MYVALALRPTAYFHPLNTWIPLFHYFLYGLFQPEKSVLTTTPRHLLSFIYKTCLFTYLSNKEIEENIFMLLKISKTAACIEFHHRWVSEK